MPVGIDRNTIAGLCCHSGHGIDKFTRAGNNIDGLDHLCQSRDRFDHLKCHLRNTIAKIGNRHEFKHHIGKAAIGGRIIRTFLRHNQRVRCLSFRAGINAHGQGGEVNFFAIRPDTADTGNLALANAHCKIGIIIIGCCGGATLATAGLC